ncbi:MAG TPA: hypothetical protein VMA34_16265 [Terracidiphilus sp.]|nr:hypothetical protein [Terracidiphilus sp.]
MKGYGLLFAVVSGAGLFAMAVPNAVSQVPGLGESFFSAPESAVYQGPKEAVPVEVALNEFDSALAAHDVAKMEAAGVTRASAKLWERFFRDNPRATVTDRCPISALSVSEDTASWTCTETATIISEGKPRAFAHVIRFTFSRSNGTWMVADRQ